MGWVKEQLRGFDVVYAGVHGSHLYSLNREGSDVDVKAIYMPKTKDLLLNHCKTYNRKNDELDVEIEIKSYPEFVRSCSKVDTNCFDLLHSPDSMYIITITTFFWEHIKLRRSNLYAQRMKGLVGYIKTHIHKYSYKIERYEEMVKLLDICTTLNSKQESLKVVDLAPTILSEEYNFKYVKVFEQVQDHEQMYLEVCGKKYIFTWGIDQLIAALRKEISR